MAGSDMAGPDVARTDVAGRAVDNAVAVAAVARGLRERTARTFVRGAAAKLRPTDRAAATAAAEHDEFGRKRNGLRAALALSCGNLVFPEDHDIAGRDKRDRKS